MQHDELPERWQRRIEALVRERRPDARPELCAYDFCNDLRIEFPDGSIAEFKYAFAITEGDETAVFTEHCGYHIVPSYDLKLKVL